MHEDETRTVLAIMGMRDNSCRERVCEALRNVPGVTDAVVSLVRARAIVTHQPPCKPAAVVWAVVNAGYGAALAGGEEEKESTRASPGATRRSSSACTNGELPCPSSRPS